MRLAFEDAGYSVVGTATSGQAARTLGVDANLAESSTLASLLWRLAHNQTHLTPRTVVILDEVGMTDDVDLLRLLAGADSAGAKVVMVGDDRQLGAVGPGGSLGALVDRHEPGVWVLDENVRQVDPAEQCALDELRAGDLELAVGWMADNGRIAVGADRPEIIERMVAGWSADVDQGLDTMMLAWRRASVDALNAAARSVWAESGRLSGPEIKAPGGRRYRAGDRMVTLAPGANGQVVTSERGTVTEVAPVDGGLRARMDDGRIQHFTAQLTGKDRMGHGYALTVHRSQGATCDTAHRLEDGGGRELAYVSMSRARERSTVWVIADDVEQAVEDLQRDWRQQRRQRWAIDSGTPSTDPMAVEADSGAAPSIRNALLQARLRAERDAVAAAIPRNVTTELRDTQAAQVAERQALADLSTGAGRWEGTMVGGVARAIAETEATRRRAIWRTNSPSLPRGEIREAKRTIKAADAQLEQLRERFEVLAAPHRDEVAALFRELDMQKSELAEQAATRTDWLAAHPETVRRLEHLDASLDLVGGELGVERDLLDGIHSRPHGRARDRSSEHTIDNLPAPRAHPAGSRVEQMIESPDIGLGL